jgi:lysylphosphatidylglycerol synthetase-like protein (DUF2156 family)
VTVPTRTLAGYEMLARYAHNPSAYLALNRQTIHFRLPGVDGFVAYREAGRFLVQFGGVFSAPVDRAFLLNGFLRFADRHGRRVVAVQLLAEDVRDYLAAGFVCNQLGASYARSLAGFSLRGKDFVKLRNKISRAGRSGVVVEEVGVDLPGTPALARVLDDIDQAWLRDKGRTVSALSFMVGERGGEAEGRRRALIAVHGVRSSPTRHSLRCSVGTQGGCTTSAVAARRRPLVPQS